MVTMPNAGVFRASGLSGLPAPVSRYLRAALREGQPFVATAVLEQSGEFRVKPSPRGWRPFRAVETFSTDPPGFFWDARIRQAPGIVVRVRDAFADGKGSVEARLFSILPVMSAGGTTEIAEAALQRYLSEACWFPTALLPSQGVVWAGLDGGSARATLRAGDVTASLEFRFGEDGLVESVFSPARARAVRGGTVPTPWQGRFRDYSEFGGMRIPISAEVEWLFPEGPQPYWRGRILRADYAWTDPGAA